MGVLDSRQLLVNLLAETFSKEEMSVLCFNLGIKEGDVGNLLHLTEETFAENLVAYCERHGRIADLRAACEQERPKIHWPHIDVILANSLHLNPNFVRRKSVLGSLHQLLQSENIAGLVGMAGMGKTQTALQYAYQYKDLYSGGVIAIDAGESFEAGFAELRNPSTHLLRALKESDQALFIIANLTKPAELRSPLVDNTSLEQFKCKLLFTRHRKDTPGFPLLDTPLLTEAEALEFLLRYRNRQSALNPNHEAHETAREICQLLGYFPLALQNAGAWLARHSTVTLKQFREALRRQGVSIIAEINAGDVPPESLLNKLKTQSIWRLLRQQWETVPSEDARLLLYVLTNLREEPAPMETLQLLARISNEGLRPPFTRAIEELNWAALIELFGDRVRLHTLVREFSFRRLEPVFKNGAFRIKLRGDEATENDLDGKGPIKQFRHWMETNIIEQVAKRADDTAESISYRAILAGRCVRQLAWNPTKAKQAVLFLLRELLNEASPLSMAQRRRVGLELLRLNWLEDVDDVDPAEMLTFLEVLMRVVDSTKHLETLRQHIETYLPEASSHRQQAHFLVWYADILTGLADLRAETEYDALITDARNSLMKARGFLRRAQRHHDDPEDSRFGARIRLAMGHQATIRAEEAEPKSKEEVWWRRRALAYYERARDCAEIYEQDPVLHANALSEVAFTHAALQNWVAFNDSYLQASKVLNSSNLKEKDSEVYARTLSTILSKASLIHYKTGQILLEQKGLQGACEEFAKALLLSQEEIACLTKQFGDSRDMAYALANAGFLLMATKRLPETEETIVTEAACRSWRQAINLARNLELTHIKSELLKEIANDCSNH